MKVRPAISPAAQFALLLMEGVDRQGRSYTLPEVAAATGLSGQTLHNLLKGTTDSPRLNTLRELCQLYGISLDYFMLDSEAACRACLWRHRLTVFPLLDDIASQTDTLSPEAQRRLTTIIGWLRARDTSPQK